MIAVAPPVTQDTAPLERPQDYGDLLCLVQMLQALDVQEPGQQAIRVRLLTKLSTVVPRTLLGGHQVEWRAP
jgi:hypothetical protein